MRERERERDRQTERQRDRETETETERQRDTERDNMAVVVHTKHHVLIKSTVHKMLTSCCLWIMLADNVYHFKLTEQFAKYTFCSDNFVFDGRSLRVSTVTLHKGLSGVTSTRDSPV